MATMLRQLFSVSKNDLEIAGFGASLHKNTMYLAFLMDNVFYCEVVPDLLNWFSGC